jgi:hypothetical protein
MIPLAMPSLSPALWTPAQITTALWLDAADSETITESSGSVSQWDDKSGSGNHATQSSGSLQPNKDRTTLNGLPVVSFDGTERMGLPSSTFNATNICVYQVVKFSETAGEYALFLYNPRVYSPYGSGDRTIWWFDDSAFFAETELSTSPELYGIIHNGTTASAHLNGSDFGSTSSSSPGIIEKATLGGTDTESRLNGFVAEVLICNSPTAGDRRQIEGYLAHKWGLADSLPSGHPYKSAAPTV